MLSVTEFMIYFKKNIFPTDKYFADKMYPNTTMENKKYINAFNKKYKRKFLYDYPDKDKELTKEDYQYLFKKSIFFLSFVQKRIHEQYNMENYISGGTALNVYAQYLKKKQINFQSNSRNDVAPWTHQNEFATSDIDTYLYVDEARITNSILVERILSLSDVALEYKTTSFFTFLDFYMILHFKSQNEIFKILKDMLTVGFDLFKYNYNQEIGRYNFVFLKMKNKELCLKITLRFQPIETFLMENIYSYVLMKYYYIYQKSKSEFKSVHKTIPIEFLVKNKRSSNLSFMKNCITFYHHPLYIYTMKTLLYNLLHLSYKYMYNKENKTIEKKKAEGKNKRDQKRLELFFTMYCQEYYPHWEPKKVNTILPAMMDQREKFKTGIEKIKDLSMIDSFFI